MTEGSRTAAWRRLLRIAVRSTVVLVVVGGIWFAYLYAAAGQLRGLEPLSPGECRKVEGAIGAEDIDVHRLQSLAFVSSDDRRFSLAERPQGAIYAYDLAEEGELVDLTADFEGELHPHGISLLEGGPRAVLFVVNHTTAGSRVEIFDFEDGRLRHRDFVEDPLLSSPNDVAAVDQQRFYATNDHGSRSDLGKVTEDLLRLDRGSVVFWDGSSMRRVAEGIAYPNGIALGPNGEELFVASTSNGVLLKYFVQSDGGLELAEEVRLGTGIDNLEIDRHGFLWAAAHPHLMTFMRHAGDPDRRSPSEGLWIDREQPLDPDTPRVRPVFLTLGEERSGSSVLVPFGSRLLIGSVFEPHFLVCERQ